LIPSALYTSLIIFGLSSIASARININTIGNRLCLGEAPATKSEVRVNLDESVMHQLAQSMRVKCNGLLRNRYVHDSATNEILRDLRWT